MQRVFNKKNLKPFWGALGSVLETPNHNITKSLEFIKKQCFIFLVATCNSHTIGNFKLCGTAHVRKIRHLLKYLDEWGLLRVHW